MRKILFATMLSLLSIACFGLSSTTNSFPFTLDTVPPELDLICPNGGEIWYLGDTNDILWTATDTNLLDDSVYLWYRLSSDTDYISLAEGIDNSGSYSWSLPEQVSNNGKVKIRIADGFGNYSEVESASSFSISYVPPAAPNNVNVNLDNNVDAIITWEPVTETIYGTPITPDGYLVLYNETSFEDSDNHYYFLWDVTEGTTFTHPRVVLHRDQMFYRVVAYKDYDGSLSNVLAKAKANPEVQLSFRELKEKVRGGVR